MTPQGHRTLKPARGRRTFAWGFVDQALSSAASLVLTVTAGRLLGPAGLGIIFVGFASYLVALGMQRAFVIDPLIATSSTASAPERLDADRSSLTIVVLGACVGTGILLAIGASSSAEFARGLLLFGPWLIPALVQDLLRSLLFRDGRGRLVTALDALWLGIMLCLIPVILHVGADWAIVGAWGCGALTAAAMGLAFLRIRPHRPSSALQWWRGSALALGRWLAAAGVIYTACLYGTVLLLGLTLGSASLGGLRAVMSAMTPLSLIAPAISLPGLPALARASGTPQLTRGGLPPVLGGLRA